MLHCEQTLWPQQALLVEAKKEKQSGGLAQFGGRAHKEHTFFAP